MSGSRAEIFQCMSEKMDAGVIITALAKPSGAGQYLLRAAM